MEKSFAPHYVIAAVLLLGTLLWALWDEGWGQRPWKGYQAEFKERYGAFLRNARSASAGQEREIKQSAEYKELDAAVKAAESAAGGQLKELQGQISELSEKIMMVQAPFTDARAHVTADSYQVETTEDKESRQKGAAKLEQYKREKQFTIPLAEEQGKKYNYYELEAKYEELKARKTELTVKLGELMKPIKEAATKRDEYLAERMVNLSPEQIEGLQKKVSAWSSEIVQINVAEANIVDRCESCHMGVREPVTLTVASMTPKGKKADQYAQAFVGHPAPDLLAIHDPQKFGCSPCHGGNGRAVSSVEQGHGRYKHWLWPLYGKANMQAGCQTCHAADMFLAKGMDLAPVVNEGKALFYERGCVGCHRYEGYDREPEQLMSIGQQIKQLETRKKENLRRASLLMKQADAAEDNQTAQSLNTEAEALKVSTSGIDLKMAQLDVQSRSLLRDLKKIGPNLKDIRAKLNKNWIPVWIRKPTDFRPTTKMPNFRLNDEQVKSMAAYLWQTALPDQAPQAMPGDGGRGQELLETRGCLGCHSIGEGSQMQGGDFAANFTRVGEKANYNYLVRWIHNPRQRLRPYCPYEKKDIGPEDYAKKGLPFVFNADHSTCPNDGHELQVQQMTVMPILRLSDQDAADIATYLMTQKKKEPTSYPEASFMDDAKLKEKGRTWIRHFGCAGCHEISGFEDEGRIGTELTFEGSKPIERLDFALLTHPAMNGEEGIRDKEVQARLPEGPAQTKWYNHKGFFEHKLAKPDIYDYDAHGNQKIKSEAEKLRMPDPHLNQEQIRALTTFLLGSQETSLPASYIYKPGDTRKDIQEGWWVVRKYNCMGCHQFVPGQQTSLMQMARYQDPDWKEQLPPKLLTEGARVDPVWLTGFLANPALHNAELNRNGVRPYLRARMPTFNFSENELRKLVRFFQALSEQPQPYIPERLRALTAAETEMARSLFTSTAAPCLKCHATGDAAHDRTATAPNFLLVKERLKPNWTERWIIDPQAISPGTSMPSGLFRRENGKWVFAGPVPASFQGYEEDHTKLLVRYMFQLTPEEQRRVAGSLPRTPAASRQTAKKSAPAARGGSR